MKIRLYFFICHDLTGEIVIRGKSLSLSLNRRFSFERDLKCAFPIIFVEPFPEPSANEVACVFLAVLDEGADESHGLDEFIKGYFSIEILVQLIHEFSRNLFGGEHLVLF